jgi:hypothetical protein
VDVDAFQYAIPGNEDIAAISVCPAARALAPEPLPVGAGKSIVIPVAASNAGFASKLTGYTVEEPLMVTVLDAYKLLGAIGVPAAKIVGISKAIMAIANANVAFGVFIFFLLL